MESTVSPRKRLTISLAPADHEWLEAQAADEGVDAVTLLGMLVTRLRQNRPALYRQALERPNEILAAAPSQAIERQTVRTRLPPPGWNNIATRSRDIADGPIETDAADAANAAELAATVADLEHEYPENGVAAETEHDAKDYPQGAGERTYYGDTGPAPVAAIPLFTPERSRFNPGRR